MITNKIAGTIILYYQPLTTKTNNSNILRNNKPDFKTKLSLTK